MHGLFGSRDAFDDWAVRWRDRLAGDAGKEAERFQTMRAANPACIPRNHLVEEAISA